MDSYSIHLGSILNKIEWEMYAWIMILNPRLQVMNISTHRDRINLQSNETESTNVGDLESTFPLRVMKLNNNVIIGSQFS